jgi:hypothetical protein
MTDLARSTQSPMKRVSIWFVELIMQSGLMILVLFLLVRPRGITDAKGIFVLLLLIMLYLGITGYAFSTVISRILWRDSRWWTYSTFSAFLFLVHFLLFNFVAGGKLLDEYNRPLFIMWGMCIAFCVTSLGSFVLKLWSVR